MFFTGLTAAKAVTLQPHSALLTLPGHRPYPVVPGSKTAAVAARHRLNAAQRRRSGSVARAAIPSTGLIAAVNPSPSTAACGEATMCRTSKAR